MISRHAIAAIFQSNIRFPNNRVTELADILKYYEIVGRTIKKVDARNIDLGEKSNFDSFRKIQK